ncbi:MAG: hypothetical protein RH862_12150 [Leptospiraceae bacterium]
MVFPTTVVLLGSSEIFSQFAFRYSGYIGLFSLFDVFLSVTDVAPVGTKGLKAAELVVPDMVTVSPREGA